VIDTKILKFQSRQTKEDSGFGREMMWWRHEETAQRGLARFVITGPRAAASVVDCY
jgi:hypothetical protein